VGPCDDATLLGYIRQAIAESRFTGEGYRKMWARLRFASIRSSPGRVRRLMRENGLLAPHRVRKRPDKAHDGSITTEAVDVLWGTDMSQTVTLAEGVAHVFVAVDHCNSECVGIHADKRANRFQARGWLANGRALSTIGRWTGWRQSGRKEEAAWRSRTSSCISTTGRRRPRGWTPRCGWRRRTMRT
jgi:transposase InsO family protein